jgi:hypothetical protein
VNGVYVKCKPSNITVIDIDGDTDFSRKVLQKVKGRCNLIAKTRKGLHLYFRGAAPQGCAYANQRTKVDVRSHGKAPKGDIIFAAPCTYTDGVTTYAYEWVVIPEAGQDLQPVQPEVIDMIVQEPQEEKKVPRERKSADLYNATGKTPAQGRRATAAQPEAAEAQKVARHSPTAAQKEKVASAVRMYMPIRSPPPDGNDSEVRPGRVGVPAMMTPAALKAVSRCLKMCTPERQSPPQLHNDGKQGKGMVMHNPYTPAPKPRPREEPICPRLPPQGTTVTAEPNTAEACPLCSREFKPQSSSNQWQYFHAHLESHMKAGEYVADTWWAKRNKYACRQCNRVMLATKEAAHRATCTERVEQARPKTKTHHAEAEEVEVVPPVGALPTLKELWKAGATMKHVPGGARGAWGTMLASLMSKVVREGTVESVTLLLMFPACTLRVATRGGKKAARAGQTNTQRVRDAVASFKAGEYEELWKQATHRSQRSPQQPTEESKAKQCIARAQDGEFARALASLTADAMAADTPATLELLRSKHPACTEAPVPRGGLPTAPITEETVLEQVLSFPRGSSAGNMGLRAEHVRCAIETSTPTGTLKQLTALVNFLQGGKAPKAAATVLAGAKLAAFEKKGAAPGTDVRPIAAGEFMRRLVSKCLCAVHKDRARELFQGLQYGVAAPGGAERVVHRMRRELTAHATDEDWVALKIDLKNAFNCVSRARMLELVAECCPDMYMWVLWCYGEATHLNFSGNTIESREGVQQGDPLGPLLFSLVIHRIITRIAKEIPGLTMNAWYLDDGVLCGPAKLVRKALAILQTDGPEMGLHLNLKKCELITTAANKADMSIFPEAIPQSKRRADGCMTLLGAAMGSDAFVSDHFRTEVLEKASRACAALRGLGDTQVATVLMRQCTGYGTTVYALRTTPPQAIASACEAFDAMCAATFEEVVSGPLSKQGWRQTRTAANVGGLGIRATARHAEAAYLSSVTTAAHLDGWDPGEAAGYDAAVARFCEKAGVELGAAPPRRSQQAMSRALDEREMEALRREGSHHTRQRLTAQSARFAGSWLEAIPSGKSKFTSPEWNILVRWWLGEDVYPKPHRCPKCNKTMDTQGYHALTCAKAGDRVHRHHNLCKTFTAIATTATLNPKNERAIGGSKHRDADVYVPVWEGSRPLAMDFAVTHTLQPSNSYQSSFAEVRPAGTWAAEYAAAHKSAGRARCEKDGVRFAAMVVEVYGAWSPEAEDIIMKLARFAHLRSDKLEPVTVRSVFQQLSVSLALSTARALLSRADPMLGENAEAGADVQSPASEGEGSDHDDSVGSDREDVDVEETPRAPERAVVV